MKSTRVLQALQRCLKLQDSTAAQSLTGLIDQAVIALSSFLPILLLGRLADAHELGTFSLALSAGLFLTLALEALVLSSYPVFRARDPASDRKYTFYVLVYCMGAQVLLLPFFLVEMWCGQTNEYGSTCAALALIPYQIPATVRHLLRYISLYRGDLTTIVLLDVMLLLTQTIGLFMVVEFGAVSALSATEVLAVTSAFFVAVWLLYYRAEIAPHRSGLGTHLFECLLFGRWALASDLLNAMPYYVFPWLLALLHGSGETAVYAAANTVVGVVSHASVGLTKSLPARAGRAFFNGGKIALHRSMVQTCRIALPMIAMIVMAIYAAAMPLSELIFPHQASRVASVVRLLSLAALAASLHRIVGRSLWATAHPQQTLLSDLTRGILAVGLGVALAWHSGAKGCAEALLVGNVAGSLMVLIRYWVFYSESSLQRWNELGGGRNMKIRRSGEGGEIS
jgi:O-antigen/teichoic acid export membrane protein